MKKMITLMLILVLTVCVLAGCRRGTPAESLATDASRMIGDMMPRGDNGRATDGDGFIGREGGQENSTMPSGFMHKGHM